MMGGRILRALRRQRMHGAVHAVLPLGVLDQTGDHIRNEDAEGERLHGAGYTSEGHRGSECCSWDIWPAELRAVTRSLRRATQRHVELR